MTSTALDSRNGSGRPTAATTGRGHRTDIPDGGPPALLTFVVHELREPLGLLHGYLLMLEEGDLTDEQRAGAVTIMRAKVLEMATVSRLDAGGLAPLPAEFDVRGAVDEAVAAVSARATLARAAIETFSPVEAVGTWADRDHIVRILVNLLTNSLSYCRPPARIAVHVRPGDPVEVSVRDHGRGIPTDQQERVFQRWTRLEEVEPLRSPGFRLGLPLSRELAEANGGTLELERSVPAGVCSCSGCLPAGRGGPVVHEAGAVARAGMGSALRVRWPDGVQEDYTIVAAEDADPAAGRIAVTSPWPQPPPAAGRASP